MRNPPSHKLRGAGAARPAEAPPRSLGVCARVRCLPYPVGSSGQGPPPAGHGRSGAARPPGCHRCLTGVSQCRWASGRWKKGGGVCPAITAPAARRSDYVQAGASLFARGFGHPIPRQDMPQPETPMNPGPGAEIRAAVRTAPFAPQPWVIQYGCRPQLSSNIPW